MRRAGRVLALLRPGRKRPLGAAYAAAWAPQRRLCSDGGGPPGPPPHASGRLRGAKPAEAAYENNFDEKLELEDWAGEPEERVDDIHVHGSAYYIGRNIDP
mmetsp:Transcript_3331/g.9708  ORF Transcript_3331/g.9708 Transcript_3331/m.9708 type:complete len:101 (-) Transcript_3331:19-321(-)